MKRSPFSDFASGYKTKDASVVLLGWIEHHPEERLPSVRELSRALGISSRDVVRALDDLRVSGRIETRSGSGSWPIGLMPTSGPFPMPKLDPRRLALELRERIDGGEYPTGRPLPTAKAMAREWDCHPQTASKVFAILHDLGLVERIGRNWTVARPRSSQELSRPKLLLVGAPDDNGELRMDTDREVEFWREVSNEAARNGLETTRHLWTGSVIRPPIGTLGLVASTWHVPDGNELLLAAARTHLPVCTWQEGLDEDVRKHPASLTRLYLHDVAHSARAGHDLARHLIDRGYRRVAWISPFHGASWSQARESGLRATLEASGCECCNFTLDAVSEWDFFSPAWSDPQLWKILPTDAIDGLTDGRSRPVVAKTAEQLGRSRIFQAWSPILESALSWNADAWVACNDLAAVLAKEWLSRRGGWDPDSLGLAGFDDSSESLRQDLTSYRFETAAMARSMVLQILSWRKERSGGRRVVRHGGTVVARGSTTASGRRVTSA